MFRPGAYLPVYDVFTYSTASLTTVFYVSFRESPDGEEDLKELTTIKQPLLSTQTMDLMVHLRSLRRKRRRARRLHQPRLMRVGCSLGTCQVQNLNHRLWQLMGQKGKEDSPIQLSNPHSFG